jgi:diketogulonate reductase-like aldo/keto reductase
VVTQLNLSHVDLYLLPSSAASWDAWVAMEHVRDVGLARSIGVSGFDVDSLAALQASAKHPPTVDQVRFFVVCEGPFSPSIIARLRRLIVSVSQNNTVLRRTKYHCRNCIFTRVRVHPSLLSPTYLLLDFSRRRSGPSSTSLPSARRSLLKRSYSRGRGRRVASHS